MLTIVILFRNAGRLTRECVGILLDSLRGLYLHQRVELLLIDDASEPGSEVAPLLLPLKEASPFPVRILRFNSRQHYTRGLAHALSLAKGHVLFISHDMLAPRAYIRGLLQVAALDPSYGIVRGTSTYVDLYPQYTIEPPGGIGDSQQLNNFSDYIANRFGLAADEHDILTGDSMLISRAVIDKIGTFDPAFFGYFGDIDYGLRAQRAGFKIVCAMGAWLFHEGAGYYNTEVQRTGRPMQQVQADRMKVVSAAYLTFRQKWNLTGGPPLPPQYVSTSEVPFKALRAAPNSPPLFQPLLPEPTPDIAQWL